MNDRIEEWKKTTWQIRPTLDFPELDPEVVQYAALGSDPIEEFRKLLRENRDRFLKEVAESRDPSQRELLKRAQISVTWDGLFHTTPGDQVYLLIPSRSKNDPARVRKSLVSSNAPQGRRWLTTRVTILDDRPICWCIPFGAATGESVEIGLRQENLFDLWQEYQQCVEAG